MPPHKVHRHGHYRNWDVEKEDAKCDGEIQQERNQPAEIIAMQDETSDPPARKEQMSIYSLSGTLQLAKQDV
jgi:hypothetical protein